jgi:cell division inhibitor SulA
VFCLDPEPDPVLATVMDVDRWDFWVMPTAHIEREFGNQKSVVLSRIRPVAQHATASTLRAVTINALASPGVA